MVFEVGEPDVGKPAEDLILLIRYISPCVGHHGDRKAAFFRLLQCGSDLYAVVIGRHEVDVVGAFFLQFKEYLREPFAADRFPRFSPGYLSVLAEYASELASAEEHRPGSALAGYAGLLPEMKRSSRYKDISGHPAGSLFAGVSVGAAPSGAQRADDFPFLH